MKKRYLILLVLLCLLVGLGVFFGPKLYRAVRVYRLVEDFLSQPEQSLDVTVLTGEKESVQFRLDWQDRDGKRIYTLESGSETVHYCGGVVYLKNGKGYRFSEAIPDLTPVLENPWLLAPLVQIRHEGDSWLLAVQTQEILPEIRYLNITMEEAPSGISTLYVHTMAEKMGDFTGLTVTRQDRTCLEVPAAVLASIESGTVQAGKDLTRDSLRLVKGWLLLNSTDPLGVELELQVDLLELPLHTRMELQSTRAYGKPIHYLSRDGEGFYFTDGRACTAEGIRAELPEVSMDMTSVLGLAYYLCFNGDLSCEGDSYRLELDQEGMEQVLHTIAPETKDMAMTLTQGTLEVRMEGDSISEVAIAMNGQVDLVITQVDIAAQVQMKLRQEGFEMNVPQRVLDALLE